METTARAFLSISDWQRLSRENPAAAVQHWQSQWYGVPTDEARAAVALTRPEETFRAAFEAGGRQESLLAGVPVFIKDCFDLPGYPTYAGSKFLPNVRPNGARGALVRAVEGSGAVIVGKTHMVEFAYGLSGENAHYGNCPHPWLRRALSGGSSSGSAWAVGKGLVPFAVGTDTAGSIRVPAAFCGIFGLRLVPGLLGPGGLFPLAPSFDAVGWFARSLGELLHASEAMLPTESAEAGSQRPPLLYAARDSDFLDDELRAACAQAAKRHGAGMNRGQIGEFRDALQDASKAYNILGSRQAFEVHRAWLDVRKADYSPLIWERIDRARRWSAEDVRFAMERERSVRQVFAQYLDDYGAIVLPVTPLPSPGKAEMTNEFRGRLLGLTTPASLARLPALTIPVMLEDGRSGGLQFITRNVPDAIALMRRFARDGTA